MPRNRGHAGQRHDLYEPSLTAHCPIGRSQRCFLLSGDFLPVLESVDGNEFANLYIDQAGAPSKHGRDVLLGSLCFDQLH
ncbi:MAG: hypothetical protein CMJ68_20265 [Planctomycetaceae bacterium]|nr:hypothetical protein [Planctomycetaceae bacterium]